MTKQLATRTARPQFVWRDGEWEDAYPVSEWEREMTPNFDAAAAALEDLAVLVELNEDSGFPVPVAVRYVEDVHDDEDNVVDVVVLATFGETL